MTKHWPLGDFLRFEKLDVIFLQETLGDGDTINNILKSFLPGWTFHTLDVRGRFGGCALGFNNRTTNIDNICGREGGLGAYVISEELGTPL